MSTFPKLAIGVPNLRGKGGCYCGRRGLPREWVLQMYADYQRLGSLEKVGRLHDRTRQSMYGLFKKHGLKLNPRTFLPVVTFQGRKYTEQKTHARHRYLRCTVGRTKAAGTYYLHHVVWEKAHGPVPPGYKLVFKNGNHRNCRLSNLELLTNSEQVRRVALSGKINNQATKFARAQLGALMQGSNSGRGSLVTKLKR